MHALDVAMAKGYDSINMIAHSWGTCITYDAIEQSGLGIKNWVTMGSPLRGDIGKPANVGRWSDFYSNTDPVTWLNCFPPFPEIDTECWQSFALSIAPLASNVTWGESSIHVNANLRRDETAMRVASLNMWNWWRGLLEHTAYWDYSDVQTRIKNVMMQ